MGCGGSKAAGGAKKADAKPEPDSFSAEEDRIMANFAVKRRFKNVRTTISARRCVNVEPEVGVCAGLRGEH
jgi:hypothetical protein